MGRFRNYINEGKNVLKIDNIEEMLELVEKDCKPFLTEIRKKKGFVLKRSIDVSGIDFLVITPRKDRYPTDTKLDYIRNLIRLFIMYLDGKPGLKVYLLCLLNGPVVIITFSL